MSKLRYIILLSLCLVSALTWAQRRYSASGRHEYSLGNARGFTTRDVEKQTDVLQGLHDSQYAGAHHMIGFSAEGGWSSFVSSLPGVHAAPGGGAAGLHFLYEFQYSGFILQTGLGIAWQKTTNNIGDTAIYHDNMPDQWSGIDGATYRLKHTFNERQDKAQNLYGQLPLYVGHYFFGRRGIGYFLGGVRVNYAFMGSTELAMTGSTSGLYSIYVGIWEEMDNHGFRKDVPLERSGDRLNLKFDLMAHLEIGYEYNTRQNVKNYRLRPSDRMDGRLRIGAFADFGMLDITPGTKNAYYGIPEATIYDFPTYQAAHFASTDDARKYWTRNLFVGVRVTFLFGFQPKEHCILCDTWRH